MRDRRDIFSFSFLAGGLGMRDAGFDTEGGVVGSMVGSSKDEELVLVILSTQFLFYLDLYHWRS